jgi:crotonobetainyl-CoA:carnitine CoA-transferase CaiB-like acyl-CoA transferase
MPLTGLKVVDMTRILSGPFCTMMLADFGADVIKVEPPRGDDTRRIGIQGDCENPYFVNMNRNKRSIAVDLRTDEGKEIIRRLAKTADVVTENFRPGVMDNMGLGYAALKKINPGIIYAAVNGFGNTGPYKDRPAFDFIAQAMSGFMSVNGNEDMDPIRAGIPITDTIAGLYAAFGILAALRRREQTGQGEEVQTAMVDGMISMLTFASSAYFATGNLPPRTGNDHMVVSPYGVFQTANGPLAVAPSTEKTWLSLCKVLDLEHLITDPKFDTNKKRIEHRKEINRIVNEKMRALPRDEWMQRFNQAGVPCGPINNLKEVFSDPQVLHQEMVLESNQPTGPVRMPGFPVKLSCAPARLRRPSPQIGEHNREILLEAGYSDAEIDRLEQAGVIIQNVC